jgi:hypothetical protein
MPILKNIKSAAEYMLVEKNMGAELREVSWILHLKNFWLRATTWDFTTQPLLDIHLNSNLVGRNYTPTGTCNTFTSSSRLPYSLRLSRVLTL